ncbi:MAG: hypothetical protein Q4F29_08470 [Lachnospiraceae bacterium]|nr:hypothetical protein [Lachnospiraceae bacterium]
MTLQKKRFDGLPAALEEGEEDSFRQAVVHSKINRFFERASLFFIEWDAG